MLIDDGTVNPTQMFSLNVGTSNPMQMDKIRECLLGESRIWFLVLRNLVVVERGSFLRIAPCHTGPEGPKLEH